MILKKSVIDKLDISNFVKNEFNLNYDCYYSDKVFLLELNVLGNVNNYLQKEEEIEKEYIHFYILLKLIKENLPEDKIVKFENERKNGTFYVLIPFHNEDYVLEK